MIFYLRRYLLTIIVFIVALVWDAPLAIEIAGVAIAFLLDLFVSSRSKDLPLYRDDLDFDAPVKLMGWREAARLHVIAILAGPSVALIPLIVGADATVQRAFSMAALLICGAIASYCGLLYVGPATLPRELIYRTKTTSGEMGLVVNLLPSYPRALIGGLLRILLAPLLMVFFPLFLAGDPDVPVDLKFALMLIGGAYLFQLNFILICWGLFTLRWLHRPNDVVHPPFDPAR